MPVKFWHTSLRFRFFLSYLITTVSSILPTRHFESNWHLAIIYIILNWNVRLYLCYSGNDMEILTYKSGGFQPRIPKSTYSCSFWWIYFLIHSILPTKNPILTSLQCINQVIFRMIDFSIIDFESLLFSSVLFQIPIWMYLLDITDSIGLNAFKWHKMTEALTVDGPFWIYYQIGSQGFCIPLLLWRFFCVKTDAKSVTK